MKRKGFTLIELLVVIAIIAILAAILFPVFAKAREKARQIVCLSNTKQIGLAVTQYEQDYDEKGPNGWDPYGRASGWAWQVYPYVKSKGAFQCPDDAGGGKNTSSFGMNANLGGTQSPTATRGNASGLSIAAYSAPAKTVLLFEVANGSQSNYYDLSVSDPTNGIADNYNGDNGRSASGYGIGGNFDPSGAGTTTASGAAGSTASDGHLKYATGVMRHSKNTGNFLAATGRHTDGSNFLMADNHAKWFRPGAVSAGYNDPSSGYCGDDTYNTAANTDCSDSTIAVTFSYN